MISEPRRALAAALGDGIPWIRIGAARATGMLAPRHAAALLMARAAALPRPAPVEEGVTLARALAPFDAGALDVMARALQASVEDTAGALAHDAGHWGRFVREQVGRKSLTGPLPRLAMPFFAAWNAYHPAPGAREGTAAAAGPEDSGSEAESWDTDAWRAWQAQARFRQWRHFAVGVGDHEERGARVDAAFAPALALLDDGQPAAAARALIAIAVTLPDPMLRLVAAKVLPAFGTLACAPLLAILAGASPVRPGEAVIAAIREETRGVLPARTTPERLGAFLAGEALQNFSDDETALALAQAAVTWTGEARAAAMQVVAQMSVEVGLPALVWAALNRPAAAERAAAADLLERIVHRDGALGITFHRVGAEEIPPDTLGWLDDVVTQGTSIRPWLTDVCVALAVLREAVAALPDMVGGPGLTYNKPPTGDRLEEFARSLSELQADDGGGAAGGEAAAFPASPEAAPGPSGSLIGRMGTIFTRTTGIDLGKTVNDRLDKTIVPPGAGGDRAPPAAPAPDAVPPPAETRLRHPEASFPARCRLDAAETLAVRLRAQATAGTAPPFAVPFLPGQREVELLVQVMAAAFEVEPAHAVLKVPRDGPTDAVRFRLTARRPGRHAIDIKFRLGTADVGHCAVVTEVAEDGDAEAPPGPPRATGAGPASTPGGTGSIVFQTVDETTLDPHGAADAVLQVRTEPDERLAWSLLIAGQRAPVELGRSARGFGPQEAAALGAQTGPLIRQTLDTVLSRDALRGVLALLSGVGAGLFAQIAPPGAAAQLDLLPDNALLVIDSDADWVPWELLACRAKDDLWGQRFNLVRAPVATRPPDAQVAPPGVLSPTLDQVALIVGDEVSRPRNVGAATFGSMVERVDPEVIERDWPALQAAVAGKDVVHFTCHGRREPIYFLSYKAGAQGHLVPRQAHALGLKWGAVVFVNACSSSAPALLLAEFQSFGREFYFAGARPFIGTLGPVPQHEAMQFAALFYDAFAVSGLTAGQAMRSARMAAANTLGRPVWLYYCLYGEPSVSRRWSLGAGRSAQPSRGSWIARLWGAVRGPCRRSAG